MAERPYQPGSPALRVVTGSLALSVAVASTLWLGSGPAAAAAPQAQAVGRFLDGAAGGHPIQQIADLKDARARYPGGASGQNPLDVTVGGQATIPLSNKLQLPGGNVFHVGVANQIAKAHANGYALGAAGAVANQGGASLGGASGSYPSNATLSLSAAALPSSPIPLPGAGQAAALGGITASIGAVSAKAYTPAGFGRAGVTHYNIASLDLTLASPALGRVLKQVGAALTPPSLPAPLPSNFPKACSFGTQFLSPVSLAGGAVTIDPTGGAISVHLAALLRAMGANINYLPANTDLLAYLLNYLTSPKGLAAGLQNALTQTLTTQKQNFANCVAAISKKFPAPLNGVVNTFFNSVTAGQTQLANALNGVVKQLSAAGGSNPLAPLANGLKQALDIGVNVQPNGPRGTYSSPLRATPDQATAVVPGQTIVRALEIDLGGGQGASLALANAAAGPSSPPAAPPATAPAPQHPRVLHNHAIPTGVPAGQGPIGGGSSELPFALLGVGLAFAAAGALAWRRSARGH